MSLIGSLELIKLSSILQRIEAHEKTGLLIIKQGRGTWVELYFRDGRLMCIGPLRTNATLADRLLYDGVISHQAYQEVVRIVGSGAQSEIPFAMALMDNGFATQEQLRQWASRKAIEVLQALLSWTSGEIHFEDQYAPQPDRLLVALSVSALLAGIPEAALPAQPSVSGSDAGWLLNRSQAPNSASSTPPSRPYVARIPTLTQPSQFFADAFPSITPVADVSTSATFAAGGDVSSSFPRPTPVQEASPMPQQTSPASHRRAVPVQDVERVPTIPTRQGETSFASLRQASQTPNLQAIPVQNIEMQPTIPAPPQETDSSPAPDVPGMFSAASLLSDVSSLPFATEPEPSQPAPATAPAYVDISYMRPEMVLVPADLSAVRDARAMVQMTPDQWRLLTRVDGQTSLHAACQDLNMPPDMVCRLAGELIALHVIALSQPFAPPVEEMSPVAREMMASGLGNGYVAPGYAAATTSPLSSAPLQAPPSGPLQGPPSGPLQGSPSMPVPQQATSLPFETDSQWGNGGNGAIFVPGRGWVTATQSTQLMPGEAADPYFGDYISAGGR